MATLFGFDGCEGELAEVDNGISGSGLGILCFGSSLIGILLVALSSAYGIMSLAWARGAAAEGGELLNDAKYEEGPEERVTALLMTEKSNVNVLYCSCRHATRAARKPGGRGALVFNLDCADMTEKEVQEHFKAAIKKISTH